MSRVHLDWPEPVLAAILAELGAIGIDEGTAEMAADIVASRLVIEIAEGRMQVGGANTAGAGESDG